MMDRDEQSGGADERASDFQAHELPEQGGTREPEQRQDRGQDGGDGQGQGRDDGGRFAKRQPQSGQDQGRQPQGQDGGQGQGERQEMVPHAALHAAREEARTVKERYGALEGRFNDLQSQFGQVIGYLRQPQPQPQPRQEPQPAPDFFASPEDAFAHHFQQRFNPFQEQVVGQLRQTQTEAFQDRIEMSKYLAAVKYGDEAVTEAEAALDQHLRANPHAKSMLQSRLYGPGKLPGVELVKWHQEQSALSRYGSDPTGYIEAEIQRRLAAMGGQPPAPQSAPQQQPHPAAQGQQAMPSNFAGARSGAPRGGAASSGPRPLSEILGR